MMLLKQLLFSHWYFSPSKLPGINLGDLPGSNLLAAQFYCAGTTHLAREQLKNDNTVECTMGTDDTR